MVIQKHKPVAPGEKFRLSQNTHINRNLPKLGVKDSTLTKFRLTAISGKEYIYKYPNRKNMSWNNKEDVNKLTGWIRQVFRRCFRGNEVGEVIPANKKARWSQREKASLRHMVKNQIRKSGKPMDPAAWKSVLMKHNTKFAGTTIDVGEPLATNTILKKSHEVPERTEGGVATMIKKWADFIEMIAAEEAELPESEPELADDETDSELEPDLEDSSDDEEDGARPAAQTTGGILVTA